MARTSQRYIPVALVAIAVVLLAVRIGTQFAKQDEAPSTSLVKWVSIEEGIALARSTNKPILFDFTAEWCKPCHMLDAEVFQNAQLAQLINERYVAVRVVDRQQEEGRNKPDVDSLQQRYSVQAFPTLVIADAAGAELSRMEGFRGRAGFEALMMQAGR
jgi:thiol:disulfide interchange protein